MVIRITKKIYFGNRFINTKAHKKFREALRC